MAVMTKAVEQQNYTHNLTQTDTLTSYIMFLLDHQRSQALRELIITVHFFRKLIGRFTHSSLKNILVDNFISLFLENLDAINKLADHVIKTAMSLKQENEQMPQLAYIFEFEPEIKAMEKEHDIRVHITLLDRTVIRTYALLVDAYFVKRFLDKPYIQNGIIYCGAAHVVRMIYFLVRYMNFKLTHGAKLPAMSLTEIHNAIAKQKHKNIESIYKLLFSNEPATQCTSLANFPPDFA